MENAVWTIPAERMKGEVEHRIPLSRSALEVLEQAKAIGKGAYVFGAGGMPLGSATMLKILRRERVDSTVHGFRSSFRQWCQAENVPFEVAEAASGAPPKRSGRARVCAVGLLPGAADGHECVRGLRVRRNGISLAGENGSAIVPVHSRHARLVGDQVHRIRFATR